MTDTGQRYADLDRLMLMARTHAQVIQVVSIGAGDAFIERYWPRLRSAVELGHISLLIVDNQPLSELAAQKVDLAKDAGETSAARGLERAYGQLMQDIEAHHNTHVDDPRWIHFVNLSDPSGQAWLDRIRADVVFVLVPDYAHIRVAQRWLRRATLIMIEKPYDKEYPTALDFEKALNQMLKATDEATGGELPGTVVSPFDHYLAKIHNYVRRQKADHLESQIGSVSGVAFALLESGPVEKWRAATLKGGMVYDLFSHVLAMLSVELNLSSFQTSHRRTMISVARHSGLEDFEGDTFADFQFDMKNHVGAPISVKGQVGKGVGEQDEKHLTLIGQYARLHFELGRSDPGIFKVDSNERRVKLYDINEGHKEFLDSILGGRFQEDKIGWLKGDVALQILRTIYNIRKAMPSDMPPYTPGDSKEKVMEIAAPIFGHRVT